MCSMFGGDNTVNQTQTYRPNKQAANAITGALNQTQQVAQTPFQTPVAPVAGFSGQQRQAFDLANQIPGAAMPYINEGADFLRGQGVDNFYNPMASNVIAGLKDIFGQQMSQSTGGFNKAAGGVGNERTAVAQGQLAKEQGLAAGQTLSNLWQNALSASQNAGYGLANMGNLAQQSQMQGMNALLGTGGLQQQQQQAEMNAPYQNQLARIQWPYQNAQFLNQGVAALAPGLGGTTTGNTQYPQQSPLGTIAGLGMAGAGLYGMSGGQYGLGSNIGNAFQGVTGFNPAGIARGYADGGAVDEEEIPGGHPVNVMEHSLIPQGQLQPIQPHIPQLQAPQQQSGGGLGSLVGMAAKVLPMILAAQTGGRVPSYAGGGVAPSNPFAFADGGATDDPPPWLEGLRRATEAMDITRMLGAGPSKNGQPPMMDWTMALMGLRPSGIRLGLSTKGNPVMNVRGPGHTAGTPITNHPAQQFGPAYLGINAASNQPLRRASRFFENPEMGGMGKGMPEESPGTDIGEMGKGMEPPPTFSDRFAPAEENPFRPVPVASSTQLAPEERVPMPRPVVRTPAKKRVVEIVEEPRRALRPFIGHASGFADGGEVEDFDAPLFLRSGMEEVPVAPPRPRSQFEAKPLGGNRGALATDLENARYLRDNPGKTLSAIPSVVGNIVGSAIENRREPGPQQMGAPRRQEKTWLPGVGNIFDMSANAAEADHDPRPIEPVIAAAADEAKAIEAAKAKIAAQRTSVAAARAKKNEQLALAREGVLAGMERDLAQLEGPQSPLGVRRAAAMENYKNELERWQLRNENLASRKMNAGQPYAVKFPEWQEGMQKWSAPFSAGTGALFGAAGALKGHPIKAAIGAGLMGAGEGAYASLWPTLQDAEHLPAGSEHNKGAIARLYEGDPDTWRRAGVGAMTHGPIALGTSVMTSHAGDIAKGVGRGVAATARGLGNAANWWRNAPNPSTAAGNILPEVVKRTKTIYEPQGGAGPKYSLTITKNGREQWREVGKGHTISKPDISKHKAGKPEEFARGGYAAGGVGSDYAASNLFREPATTLDDRWNAMIDETPGEVASRRTMPTSWNSQRSVAPAGQFPEIEPDEPDNDADDNPYAGKGLIGASAMAQGSLQNATSPQGKSLANNPWMALLSAGLGTMASAGQRDARGLPMSPLAAIGHGGQQGIKQLETQREAAMKQQSLEQAAKRLDQQAKQQMMHLTETSRHNLENEKRQKEALDFQKSRLGAGLFDPETINMAAEQALTGDKSVFTGLARTPQNITAVRMRMNELAKERGLSGRDIAAANANFSAQTAAARTTATREANIATAVEEAKGTFPLALAASGNLPRTDYTPINRLMAAVRSGTSTPEQAEFALAHQAVITAYSQAMSRTGVNTVHAQERAEKAFSDVQNHESYERAIQQLEREMAVALSAPEKARQMILNKITGKTTEEHSTPTPRAPAAPKAGGEAPKDGEIRTNKNGVKGRYDAATKQWHEVP